MPTITLEELERQFGRIAVVATDLSPVTKVGSLMYLSEIQHRFDSSSGPDAKPWIPLKFPRVRGGSKPLQDTGLLRASFTSFATGDSFGVTSNAKQARLMNYGGIVRPVRAGALTIPLTKAALYAGKARNMQGLFILKRPGGQRAVLARREPNRQLVAHWLLVDSVKIPARTIVGFTSVFLDRFKRILVDYLRTGRL